jgi:hypothetical protein
MRCGSATSTPGTFSASRTACLITGAISAPPAAPCSMAARENVAAENGAPAVSALEAPTSAHQLRPRRGFPCRPPLAFEQHRGLVETALSGWAYRTRTGESVRALSDWNRVTSSPEVGASQRGDARGCPQERAIRVRRRGTPWNTPPSRRVGSAAPDSPTRGATEPRRCPCRSGWVPCGWRICPPRDRTAWLGM